MDLIDGVTLARRLDRGRLGNEETARVGAGVAAALACVHAQGIVHRDVKPENVLLDFEGTPYLADFGIARLLGATRVTVTGVALGTPAYLAPEQVVGNEIGPEADVYALGLVLIECLSGRRAFEGTEAETLAARLHCDPVVPATVGESWRWLLTSMTARPPSERVTAAYVSESLSTPPFTYGPTTVLPPPSLRPLDSTVAKKTRQSRRYRVVVSAVGAATLLVLGLVLGGVLVGKTPHPVKATGSKLAPTSRATAPPASTRPLLTTTVPVTKSPVTVPSPANRQAPTGQVSPNLETTTTPPPTEAPSSTVTPSKLTTAPRPPGSTGQPGPGQGNSHGDGQGQWREGRHDHGNHYGFGHGDDQGGNGGGTSAGQGNGNGHGNGS